MQKWEYMTITFSERDNNIYICDRTGEQILKKAAYAANGHRHEYLNEAGEKGWELVANQGSVYYLKRPIE